MTKLPILSLAASSLLLFACGGGSDTSDERAAGANGGDRPSGVNAVLAAVAQAEDVSTVHFSMTVKVSGGEDIGDIEFGGKGATDNANSRSWFAMSVMGWTSK